jgi:hypothetical protein
MKTTRFLAMMIAIAISAAASIDTFAQRNAHKSATRSNQRMEAPSKGGMRVDKPTYKQHKPMDKLAHKPQGKPHAGGKSHGMEHGKHFVPRHSKTVKHIHHAVRPYCCNYSHWKTHRPKHGTIIHHLPTQHTVVIRDGRPFFSVLGVLLTQVIVDGVVSYIVVD